MKPTERDVGILRAFAVGGAMTYKELASQLCVEASPLKDACERLYGGNYLDAEPGAKSGAPRIYSLSSKSRRLLERTKEVAKGEMPTPRQAVPFVAYSPRPIVTRPGSGDAFALPSLRGQDRVPHSLPLSLAGGER